MILAHPSPAIRRRPAAQGFIPWATARPWLAISVVLATWLFAPEARRLMDWKVGFSSISVVSALPLLVLVPAALPLLYGRAWQAIDPRLRTVAWVWFGGFTFSLAVGVMSGNTFAALYAFAGFCLPAIFGLWVASLPIPGHVLYEKTAAFLLWSATALSVYGIFQYITLPAWDQQWMLNTNIVSIGVAAPFQFRPYSTLNAPDTFAYFLAFTILLNIPRIKFSNRLAFAQIVFLVATLGLTMVRAGWTAFLVGLITFILLSPDRARKLTMVVGVALVCGLLITNAGALLGSSQAGNGLDARFQTFTDLSNDTSFNDRLKYYGGPLVLAAQQPMGEGLGLLGTAAKLGASGTVADFDNGYIARFTEMGWFGTACYLLALGLALRLSWQRWREFTRSGQRELAAFAASIAAVQMALMWLDVAGDHHDSLAGVFFWLTLALAAVHPTAVARTLRVPVKG